MDKNRQASSAPAHGGLFGALAIIGGLLGFAGLYFVPIPEGNREPLLLALGLVLGWGSTVIGYEFGSSPSARQAANAGIRPQDRVAPDSAGPTAG